MKLESIIDVLLSSIEGGDSSIFMDIFMENDSFKENLDSIFIKIRECLSVYINNLPEDECLLSNVLHLLTDLIQNNEINDVNLALHLVKTLLLVITDENCCITNIKKAVNAFNLIVQKQEIAYAVVNDESLEGSLQILGRKVSSTGDFECQNLMFEALYRITCNENREYWVNIWFSDTVARSMFMELDPEKFEANCRKILNYINRNEPERRVFSTVAISVMFGSFKLTEPHGCEMWIDFNYDSQSISFYSSEVVLGDPESSGMWETILISDSSVKSYFIEDKRSENQKELILLLNCPCHTLITASNIANPAFNSFEVRILVWGILDLHQHLEKIYGKEKYADFSPQRKPKVSVPTDVIRIENGEPNVLPAEMLYQRKVSNLTVPISVGGCESKVLSTKMLSQRKVSNLTSPISVGGCESEEVILDTDQNQNISVIRKVSQTTEMIHFATEVSSENLRNQGVRKISASSEVIQVETYKVDECKQKKTKRRSSVSVDTILYESCKDVYQNSNSPELHEKLEEIPSTYPKRKVSCSAGLKIENEKEHPVPTQEKKRRTRRKSEKKQSVKLPSYSLSSLNTVNNTLNLEQDQKHILKEKIESTTNDWNNSISRKSVIQISETDNCQMGKLKGNAPDVALNEYLEKKNADVLVVDSFDRNKSENILNSVGNEAKQETDCLSLIEETLNEKTICLDRNKQSEHNDSCTSAFIAQDTLEHKEKLSKDNETANKRQENELSTLSKETDNCEIIPKTNHRRVRLYNLESAPVYDVPPLTSSSDPASQDHFSSKPGSHVCKEIHADISENMGNTYELKEEQKGDSVIHKTQSKWKRSSQSLKNTEQKTKKGKQIRQYDYLPESDEDFQVLVKRDTDKRRGGKSPAATSTLHKQKSTRKRKFEAAHSSDSQDFKEKSVKRPRRAAVKARRKTREILDSKSMVVCDKIEVMNDSNDDSENTPMWKSKKRKRHSKISTDTETMSSEVSWMKQNKPTFLFETPKKNYTEWRKSLQKKKELPVKIITRSKFLPKEETPHKKKKNLSAYLSADSETKSKSLGWSDLENYNLTVEKNTKQNSYPIINALESDFQSISASAPAKPSHKESLHSHSQVTAHGTNSDFKDNSRKQLKNTVEIVTNDEMMNDHSNISRVSQIARTNQTETFLNTEISNNVKGNHFSSASNDDAEMGDLTSNQNLSNIDELISPPIDQDEHTQDENEEKSEKYVSNHILEDTEEIVTGSHLCKYSSLFSVDDFQENNGKGLILQRFLKSIADYSETQKSSSRTHAFQNCQSCSPHASTKSYPAETQSAKSNESLEFQHESGNKLNLQPPSEESASYFQYQNNKIKNGSNKSLGFAAKVIENKITHSSKDSYNNGTASVNDSMAKKVNSGNSRPSANSFSDLTTDKNVKTHKSTDKPTNEKIVPLYEELYGPEISFKKHNQHKKSKDFSDKSFISLHSKLTSSSFENSEDNKWFDQIAVILTQDANNLSRKLLATVQKCFCDFIFKMNTLRENIIKTFEEFEIPSSQNTHQYKIKSLVKNCKIMRFEVEKSLRKLYTTGTEYFEAEEKSFRKLKRKHRKASEKFLMNMRKAEKNSVRKLEGKVLLKTKSYLKRLLKHIQSV